MGWTSRWQNSGDIERKGIDFGILLVEKPYFCRMKNLPIGLQTLESIRELNCVYVDKTQMIHRLVTKGKYYFLSRPRRFGKSLLISTMKSLFLGKKELFEGTWIENNWDWSKTNPVIHFSFDKMSYQSLGLDGAIIQEIKIIAKAFKVRLSQNDVKGLFNELLEKVSQKHGSIVLLIDEYDKPIIDFLEFPPYEQAKVNQNIMRQFYSVLKSAEPYLRFFFVTGVSKFSKVSMFSELNNLKDITLHPDYATIAGYTQVELEYYFEDYLQLVENHLKTNREELVKQMRYWYNGFSWDGINKVYNPFGVLNFLDQKRFRNYWFSTGNPKFLIQQMKKQVRFDVENSKSNGYLLDKYDIDNLDLVPLCFQTGYLTVKHIDEWTEEMVLDYPNKEVRESMYQFMIDDIAKNPQRVHTGLTIRDLNQALLTNDLAKVKTIINSLLASLPYETYKNQSEGFYHGLLHLIFSYIGMFVESEPHLSQGRADVEVQTPQYIYIFEFKFNHTAEEAIAQIKNNHYADKYQAAEKPIFGIGVNFNEAQKQIDGWVVEIL